MRRFPIVVTGAMTLVRLLDKLSQGHEGFRRGIASGAAARRCQRADGLFAAWNGETPISET